MPESNEFLRFLESLLELAPGSLHADTSLKSLARWDSLAVIEFLAAADDRYGRQLAGTDVLNARDVGDLYGLVSGKRAA